VKIVVGILAGVRVGIIILFFLILLATKSERRKPGN